MRSIEVNEVTESTESVCPYRQANSVDSVDFVDSSPRNPRSQGSQRSLLGWILFIFFILRNNCCLCRTHSNEGQHPTSSLLFVSVMWDDRFRCAHLFTPTCVRPTRKQSPEQMKENVFTFSSSPVYVRDFIYNTYTYPRGINAKSCWRVC